MSFLRWLSFSRFLLLGIGMASGMGLACYGEDLTLKAVIQKAVDHSYALKIAAVDVNISKADIKAAKADYYPTLKGNINVEYLKSLDKGYRPVTTIGGTIIPAGTRFQNSVGLQFNQTLVDFGARKHKVGISQKDVQSKAAIVDQVLRDLKSELIDLYANALQSYKTIQAQEAILNLAQEAYQLKKRLYVAGMLNKVDMTEQSIQVAQALDELETAREQLDEQLQKLSFYTQDAYDREHLQLVDMDNEPVDVRDFDPEKTAEARQYDSKIASKAEEIEYLKKQNLPHASLYSYYNIYGFDPDRYAQSVMDLSQRTVSLGLSVTMPIIDGFKNRAAIEKAQLEKEKLAFQRQEALAKLTVQAQTYQQQVSGMGIQLQTKAKILQRTQYKGELVGRLSVQQVVDKTQSLQAHIEELRKGLDSEKTLIQGLVALKKRRLLEEG